MKGRNILLAISAATGAASAPIETPTPSPPQTKLRIGQVPSFQVTNFRAGTLVLSHRDYYNFYVSCHPDMPPIYCTALGTTLNERLSSIPETWCRNKTGNGEEEKDEDFPSKRDISADNSTLPRISFQWRMKPLMTTTTTAGNTSSSSSQQDDTDGAELIVVHRLGNGGVMADEGVYYVPQSQMPVLGANQFEHQIYDGPVNFSVPAFRFMTF